MVRREGQESGELLMDRSQQLKLMFEGADTAKLQDFQPIVNQSNQTGKKFDQGKNRLDLIPEDALWEVGKVYTLGAGKYGDWNWAGGIKYSRVVAALRRHLSKWQMGETLDQQDGQHHLASVAFNALALLHYDLNKERFKEFDDRRVGLWAKNYE